MAVIFGPEPLWVPVRTWYISGTTGAVCHDKRRRGRCGSSHPGVDRMWIFQKILIRYLILDDIDIIWKFDPLLQLDISKYTKMGIWLTFDILSNCFRMIILARCFFLRCCTNFELHLYTARNSGMEKMGMGQNPKYPVPGVHGMNLQPFAARLFVRYLAVQQVFHR